MATGPGRLRLGVTVASLDPRGSGWNPGATAVEGPPNRRRQLARMAIPGPFTLPTEPLRARATMRLPVARLTIVIPMRPS